MVLKWHFAYMNILSLAGTLLPTKASNTLGNSCVLWSPCFFTATFQFIFPLIPHIYTGTS